MFLTNIKKEEEDRLTGVTVEVNPPTKLISGKQLVTNWTSIMPYFVNIRHNISLSGMTISRNVRYNTCLPSIDKVGDTFGRSGNCTLYLSRLS